MIDIQIEAQKVVRKITDHLEIVKQYQIVVRAYDNFEQDFLWESTGGLQFGNMRKEKASLNMIWVNLWVTMQYPYPWATLT